MMGMRDALLSRILKNIITMSFANKVISRLLLQTHGGLPSHRRRI